MFRDFLKFLVSKSFRNKLGKGSEMFIILWDKINNCPLWIMGLSIICFMTHHMKIPEIHAWNHCHCSLISKDVFFLEDCTVKPAKLWSFYYPYFESKPFFRLCTPFLYCLIIDKYVLIFSVESHLSIIFNTSSMSIKSIWNVSTCVNDFLSPSVYTVSVS